MGYFQVRYASRVVIYECKMFIRLASYSSQAFVILFQSIIQFYNKKYEKLSTQYWNSNSLPIDNEFPPLTTKAGTHTLLEEGMLMRQWEKGITSSDPTHQTNRLNV